MTLRKSSQSAITLQSLNSGLSLLQGLSLLAALGVVVALIAAHLG